MADTAAPIRINIGCGEHPLAGFWNLDECQGAVVDVVARVPPIPAPNNSVDEVYAGHFLEHLTQPEADEFISECYRCLKPHGVLGITVPDFHEIAKRYLDASVPARVEFPRGEWHDMHDLDEICHLFLFSTVQPSNHKWAYDHRSLERLLHRHGFGRFTEINRWMDPRVSVGA